MVVRTSSLLLLLVRKKKKGLTSPPFEETLWKLVGRGQRQERGSPRTILRSIWISGIWLARENNFLLPPPLPPRIDGRPSRHYSQCCVCCTLFFFHSSSLPDPLSEIKLTVGEVSHDLTQLVLTFRWVNCITDFTVSSTGNSGNQCS